MLAATFLALGAAVLHASWNFLVKTSDERDLAAWGQFVAGGLLFAPVLLFLGLPGWDAFPFLLASTLVHVGYIAALVAAYTHGDFSLTYPLARGTGALLAGVGGVLFLADELGGFAWLAMLVVVIGLVLLVGRSVPEAEIPWALLTGVTIGVYTVIDSAGAREASDGFAYGICIVILTAAALTVSGLVRRRGRAFADSVLPQWWRYLVAGGCVTAAYSLVLVAVRYAPVGYVAMLRESSIVIGAYAGWVLLGERLGGRRVASSAVIAGGLILLIVAR